MKYKHKCLSFILVLILMILSTSIVFKVTQTANARYSNIVIVLDAGHGGRDGGSVGKNGTIEKEINLEYVKLLKNKLDSHGYRVVLTRFNDDGLYSELAKNKKISDLNKRMEIIKRANPNLVVSLHMNSSISADASGAMVYYKMQDEASNICADLVLKSISKQCFVNSHYSKEGDFFMLNCSYYTSILIECGFLSNSADEARLNNETYKVKMVESISNGILLYFGQFSI